MNAIVTGRVGQMCRLKNDFKVLGVSLAMEASMSAEEATAIIASGIFNVRVNDLKQFEGPVRIMPVFPDFRPAKGLIFKAGEVVEFAGGGAPAIEKIWVCLHGEEP